LRNYFQISATFAAKILGIPEFQNSQDFQIWKLEILAQIPEISILRSFPNLSTFQLSTLKLISEGFVISRLNLNS
jgi:hypothetical protein